MNNRAKLTIYLYSEVVTSGGKTHTDCRCIVFVSAELNRPIFTFSRLLYREL